MSENSKIEWTNHTVNPWWGCTEVHEGCNNCYARVLANRWKKDLWGTDKPRMETKNWLNDLHKYQKKAAVAGEMHRIFIGSMMDIFEKPMPVIDWKGQEVDDHSNEEDGVLLTSRLRDELFKLIHADCFPNLLFLFLTKRPSNINKYIPEEWKENCPTNVMFGTSVVNQETADKLIPQLMEAPGKKFLSMEPLLGPVDLLKEYPVGKGTVPFGALVDWVIVGGESGHHARPMHPDWVRSIRRDCRLADIPFFFKQWGEWAPIDFHSQKAKHDMGQFLRGRWNHGEIENPEHYGYTIEHAHQIMQKIGKKEAGRLLDGQLHDEFPVVK